MQILQDGMDIARWNDKMLQPWNIRRIQILSQVGNKAILLYSEAKAPAVGKLHGAYDLNSR
jgi:hypothetical protein